MIEAPRNARAVQASFEDLGTPLTDVTFVVVDLETTGGSARTDSITEIGAVKARGGEVLGEFQTLVNPGSHIPGMITALTGITDSMVSTAPPVGGVISSFLEFAHGAVLVAHNARFDVAFLKAAAAGAGLEWPAPPVLDTVHLARALVTRDEARNHKLSSLAALFGADTVPDHRALHDARATLDVLHALIGRVGSLGVCTLEELLTYSAAVPPARRRRRHLADSLPTGPGVYIFRDADGRPLYVGTSVSVRSRVRSYFTAAEKRSRMTTMVGLAESVSAVECATVLEAQVRELRLIAEHKPRFNRRSKNPERAWWVTLTDEAFPRLSVVRQPPSGAAAYAGPYGNRAAAQSTLEAMFELHRVRQCTQRLSTRKPRAACALAEIGRCDAPCAGGEGADAYADVVRSVAATLNGQTRDALGPLLKRMRTLSEQERFEEAAAVRERADSLASGLARRHRLEPLARIPHLVAARRAEDGSWEFACVRFGRFAGSARSPRGADPMPYVDALVASAEAVDPPSRPLGAAGAEETALVAAWLERPGVRLVQADEGWAGAVHAPAVAGLGRPAKV